MTSVQSMIVWEEGVENQGEENILYNSEEEFSISFGTFRSRTRSCFSDGECAPR